MSTVHFSFRFSRIGSSVYRFLRFSHTELGVFQGHLKQEGQC